MVFMICNLFNGFMKSPVLLTIALFLTSSIHQPTIQLPEPKVRTFELSGLTLSKIGPEVSSEPEKRIIKAALQTARLGYVPYVYGGKRLGSPKDCYQCSSCIRSRKLKKDGTFERMAECGSCRKCGLDCSNFVNKVFETAGFEFPFVDTAHLGSASLIKLHRAYNLLDMGRSLHGLSPGDLVLQSSHVILIVAVNGEKVDYVHSSSYSANSDIGGVQIVRNVPKVLLQRSVVKVLRHRALWKWPADSDQRQYLSAR
jgi:hypothetical protein